MTLRNSLLSFLLIIAMGLSAWSILVSKTTKPAKITADTNVPDAFMEDVTTIIMNKQGTPSLKIETPKMTHYTNNDTTYIEQPKVTIYRRSPNPWFINSDNATAMQGVSQILFSNNVVIHHSGDKENPTTTMQTNTLTVFPDKQTAQTDQAVTINQPDTIVHAVGMLANMNDGTVKLLSQAKGEYAPTSHG
jgi:lipopolysaccharide export system protein LptC